jgi:hypothetical protein
MNIKVQDLDANGAVESTTHMYKTRSMKYSIVPLRVEWLECSTEESVFHQS